MLCLLQIKYFFCKKEMLSIYEVKGLVNNKKSKYLIIKIQMLRISLKNSHICN